MAELYQDHPSVTERLARDYFHTFARLLDPNLLPTTNPLVRGVDEQTTRWPLGQTVAFATIASAGLWGLLAAIIHFFA